MARPHHIARVYAAPLSEFTATRNRLVGELRRTGHAEDAQVVSRLRKPSAPLWAVNRLAMTDARGLAALLDAVARVRRTQLRDPRAAGEALRAQRAALEALVARGREVFADAGLTASPPALRRVSDTLMGAAVDRERAEALRRGELTEELRPPGFEAFSGGGAAPGPRLRVVRPQPTAKPSPRIAQSAAAAREHEAAAARAEEARRRMVEAERLAREAADRAREVSELEAQKTAARATLAELEARLQTARRTARQVETAAQRARRRSGRS